MLVSVMVGMCSLASLLVVLLLVVVLSRFNRAVEC